MIVSSTFPRLIVASSDCPDMLYATGFFVPDPYIFLSVGGETTCVLSDLEVDRGRKQAQVDRVLSTSEIAASHPGGTGKDLSFEQLLVAFLHQEKVCKASVPASFPLGLARALQQHNIQVDPVEGLFWKQREFKSTQELKLVSKALRITEAGMARGMEVLKASDPGRGKFLIWSGKRLTSEILRSEIDCAIIRAGGQPVDTIVAGGEQACDPHERGSGPLKADSLIILDIFPRDTTTGYYGDMTRTVVRGKASEAVRKLWQTALEGQQLALATMKPGGSGAQVHQQVVDFFATRGYPKELREGRWTGFFHGTGHGLGLELHESPRFGATEFSQGQVLTVEPGLYYPGLGGVRHEDVITVTATGIRKLSRFRKELEI